MEQSVLKRRHIKFKRRGVTQKKECNKKSFILKLLKTKTLLEYIHTAVSISVPYAKLQTLYIPVQK